MSSIAPTGANVPMAVKSVIKAARKGGMPLQDIAQLCGISINTVEAVIKHIEGPMGQIAEAASENLKKDLPEKLRSIAALMTDRLAQPEVIDGLNGRDLAVALGIVIDKIAIMEQGGSQMNILVQIQSRVDQSIKEAIEVKANPPAMIAEDVEVQPCPPAPKKKSARPAMLSKPHGKPRPKRATKTAQ